jgi:hypothetical protein
MTLSAQQGTRLNKYLYDSPAQIDTEKTDQQLEVPWHVVVISGKFP